MKNIKTYEDFVNEEINLKKALATGALAAGMAFSNPATSQTTNIKSDNIEMSKEETAFSFVEEDPEFPGGHTSLMNYINSNMKYPSNKDVSGKVFLEFVVEKDGSIGDIEVTKGIEDYPEFENEAIRLLENCPKWKPGKIGGKYVRSIYRLPITFKYNPSNTITQSNTPIKSVTKIDSSQVSSIKNYETMASINLPKEFDPNRSKIYASFLYDVNIPNAPLGGIMFIHSPKLSFFVEIKSSWKTFTSPDPDIMIEDWTKESFFRDSYITWQTSYGSYTREYHDKTISSGSVEHKRIFDIGISKTIDNSESLDLKAYIGCGPSITKTEMYQKIENVWWEYSHYAAAGIDVPYTSIDQNTYYEKVSTKYESSLNITGGLLFDFNSGYQMGIGFDTKPAGINLMIGFTINKYKSNFSNHYSR